MSNQPDPDEVFTAVPLPTAWYLGAHGDPIAQFNRPISLILRADGSVQWIETKTEAPEDTP